MVTNCDGDPVDLYIRPASENDLSGLWRMSLGLPSTSIVYADGVFNAHELEDILRKDEGLI
jgi:IS5 family transposase